MEPLVVRAIKQQDIPHLPVWLMRQAGRYLTEYQDMKREHTFEELCSSAELALEISLQPIHILDVDAAIVFSDILTPLQAIGIDVVFNPGPKILNPIRNSTDINQLTQKSLTQSVPFVFQTISALKHKIAELGTEETRKTTIGFCGTPWTLACYLIDQGPFKHFQGTSIFLHQNTNAVLMLLEKLTELTIEYCGLQIEAGAEVVQLFDSWGGILSGDDYEKYSLPYVQRIIASIKQRGALATLFVNGSAHLLSQISHAKADCYSLDWKTDIALAKKLLGHSASLQGNLDPSILYDSKETVIKETKKMIKAFSRNTGYVANLGHGILQTTPRENVISFVQTVKNYA